MLHSQIVECRSFRPLERRNASELIVRSQLPKNTEAVIASTVDRSASLFGSRGRAWGGPCPRLAKPPMLRQLGRNVRRIGAKYFCPYDTLTQTLAVELLHQDLKRGVFASMKQSNLGSFFGSKSKNGDGKVIVGQEGIKFASWLVRAEQLLSLKSKE